MPSAPRVDRSNRRLRTKDAQALGGVRCCAVAMAAVCLVFLSAVAPTPIVAASPQQSATQRPQTATRVATAKTPTIVALELSRVVDGVPQLSEDAVERIVGAAREVSGLILLDLCGLPLRHALLPPASQRHIERDAYERGLSLQIAAAIKDARARVPGVAFGILGLPFEQGLSAAESNASYDAALQAVDVMNPLGGVIAAGTSPTAVVRDRYRSSLSLAAGRPVVFRGGSGWQVATAPNGPTALRETQLVVASAGRSVAVAPATAAGTSTVSVSTVVAEWGSDASGGDLNGDGIVNGFDLAVALALNPDELLVPPGGGGDGGDGGGGGTPPGGSGPGGGAGQGEDPLASAPVLVVGPGFDGPTQPPMPVGTSDMPGYNAKAIARWTDVPNQTVEAAFCVGVVAFHRNGIDRVEFSANGGPWTIVTTPARNPVTGIEEYFAVLDPGGSSDALVEVRARAVPKAAGTPRLLAGPLRPALGAFPVDTGEHSFFVYFNAAGTFSRSPIFVSGGGDDAQGNGTVEAPFRTLSRAAQALSSLHGALDGCEIWCLAGTYEFDLKNADGWSYTPANDRWVTVAAAPGVARESVVVTFGRPKQRLLALRGLTIQCSGGSIYVGFVNEGNLLWIDKCRVVMPGGRHAPGNASGFTFHQARGYATESEWYDVSHGPSNMILARNSVVDVVGEDVHFNCQVVLGTTANDLDPGATAMHPDVVQYFAPGAVLDNRVVFGLSAVNAMSQFLHCSQNEAVKFSNSAFVNLLFVTASGNPQTTHFWVPQEHVLLMQITSLNQSLLVRHTMDSDCVVVGTTWRSISFSNDGSAQNAGAATWRDNHFAQGPGFGGGSTVGPVLGMLVDVAAGDFRPVPGAVLVGRVIGPSASKDLGGMPRADPAAVGALEPPQ